MRKAVAFCLAAGTTASIFVSCTKTDDRGLDAANASTADIKFVRAAAMSNYAEVTLGKMDTAKGIDADVKDFAAMMIDDHTSAGMLLKSIANPLGLGAPDSLDAEHAALKAQLAGLSGRAFDSVYIHSQVTDHQAAIALYQAEATGGQQQKLRLFATSKLGTLQMHLADATTLAANY